jgi:hypothetical protein
VVLGDYNLLSRAGWSECEGGKITMCLAIPVRVKPTKKPVTVWKLFFIKQQYFHRTRKTRLILQHYMVTPITALTPGRWQEATRGKLWAGTNAEDEDIYYPKGFHGYDRMYHLLGPNLSRIQLQVKFRRIHTRGTQNNQSAMAAYEMLIPRNWRNYMTPGQRKYWEGK